MNILIELFQFVSNADVFAKIVLIALLVLYTLFALILTFQIFSFNRLMHQVNFAFIFKLIAMLHVGLSFIILLLVVFSL